MLAIGPAVKFRRTRLLAVGFMLGLVSWQAPAYVVSGTDTVPPLLFFPEGRTNANQALILTLGGLGVSGAILTLLDARRNPLWGLATCLPMIALSTIDGAFGLHRHNVYGVEVLVYFLYSGVPAILAGTVTRLIAGPGVSTVRPRTRVT